MTPLILTPDEARLAAADKLTEIRREVDMTEIDPVCRTWITRCEVDPDDNEAIFTSDREDLEHFLRGVPCPFGAPGSLLYGCEVWAAHWMYDNVEADEARSTRPGDNRWYQADGFDAPSHLGLQAKGYRGQWRAAETMPVWASRFAYRNRGVRVELAGTWQWVATVERVNHENGAPMVPVEIGEQS